METERLAPPRHVSTLPRCIPGIRDERDGGPRSERHMDYIHYNSIKHGHARCAHVWEWSSFHRLVRENVCEPHWCCGCDGRIICESDFEGLNVEEMEAAFGERGGSTGREMVRNADPTGLD